MAANVFCQICIFTLTISKVIYGLTVPQNQLKGYFNNELRSMNTSEFRYLLPSVALTGNITSSNPIEYFRLNLTEYMLNTNNVILTTCCTTYWLGLNLPNDYYEITYQHVFDQCEKTGKCTDDNVPAPEEYDSYRNDSYYSYLFEWQFNIRTYWRDYCNTFAFSNTTQTWHYDTLDVMSVFYEGYGCGEFKQCSTSSLDTSLYILYKNGDRFILMDSIDDMFLSSCINPNKAEIDLSSYPVGEYIIGVGGYFNETGSFQIELKGNFYSSPLLPEDVLKDSKAVALAPQLSCNTTVQGSNTIYNPISYYKFELTDDLNGPIRITNCNGTNFNIYYRVWLYLLTEDLDQYGNLVYNPVGCRIDVDAGCVASRSYLSFPETSCDKRACAFSFSNDCVDIILEDLYQYEKREYILAVQGNRPNRQYGASAPETLGNFSLSVECPIRYSYPIKSEQIDLNIASVNELSCNTQINEQHYETFERSYINPEQTDLISFYKINISQTVYLPKIAVSTCNANEDYIFTDDIFGIDILNTADITFDYKPLINSELFIAVQGHNASAMYSLMMYCGTKYSFPLVDSDINLKEINPETVSCLNTLHNQSNNKNNLISFYEFMISDVYP
eukprot:448524_1